MAALVCGLSLKFHFPGYFDPFAVFHIDHYAYVGLHHEGPGVFYSVVRYLKLYPRPFGYLILHQAGRLGLEWILAPVFICFLLNVAMMARYIERLTKRFVTLPALLLFNALIFVNPEFYIGAKMDPLAVFSLTFLLAGAHAWQSYVETSRYRYLFLTTLLMLLGTQAKESYFAVAGVFWAAQVAVQSRHRRNAIAVSAAVALFMAYGMSRAMDWTSGAGAGYAQSFSAITIAKGLWELGRLVFVPGLIAALAAMAIAGWRRDRVIFWVTASSVALGVASLLPNAALPNHFFYHYAALALLFACAPFLLAGFLTPKNATLRAVFVLSGVLVYALVLVGQKEDIAQSAGGLRFQEIIARRLRTTLAEIKEQTHPGESILVNGMVMTFNPFLAPAYVSGELCDKCRWTLVNGPPADLGPNIRAVPASGVGTLAGTYDRIVVVAPDGSLAGVYDGRRVRVSPRRLESPAGVEFLAQPNPAPPLGDGKARTTFHWVLPKAQSVEIRAETPSGAVVAKGGYEGTGDVDEARDGMVFFLQDASQGDPAAPAQTAAIVIVGVGSPQ
jgi:hypothetical protein